MADSSSPRAASHGARRRVRMSSEARRRQILSAALSEFSTVGFEGATMDRIAQRTGLTKAGLYAHFKGKEQILETLLVSSLFNQSEPPHWQLTEGMTLEVAVDGYLDRIYRLVCDPHVQATFRLLITESGRSPERLQRWSQEIFQPYSMQRQRAVDECVVHGLMPASTLSRKFSLASAPALLALLTTWFLGADVAEREVLEIRAWHREMLLTMLSREDTP